MEINCYTDKECYYIMENFLAQTFTITNHPVKKLKDIFKLQYVRGIGEFLCYITKDDCVTKTVFEIWCTSIIGKVPKDAWSYTSDFDSIKDGLIIHRDRLTFFTMRQSFLFDCFYLLEKSKKNLRLNAYTFLADKVCGFFTKGSLNYVHEFFKGNNGGDKLPEVLRRHRCTSQNFVNKKVKRVLIVAAMSAGKSTLVNALVGHKINQVRATACTSRVHYIYNKPVAEGAVASFEDNRLLYTEDYSLLVSESIHSIGVNFTSSLAKSRICLLDTPGVNYNGDKSHGELTRKIIKENNYDILILVLNAQQLAIDDEKDLIDFIGKHSRRKVVGVLNQCDAFKASQDSISIAVNTSRTMMMESGIKTELVIPISAQAAYLSRQANELGKRMDEDDAFDYELISNKMQKPFYNLPSYLPGVPKDVNVSSIIERSGVPYLEYIINNS